MEAGTGKVVDQPAYGSRAPACNDADLVRGNYIATGFARGKAAVIGGARRNGIPGAGILVQDVAGVAWRGREGAGNGNDLEYLVWQIKETHQLLVAVSGRGVIEHELVGGPNQDRVIGRAAEAVRAGDAVDRITVLGDQLFYIELIAQRGCVQAGLVRIDGDMKIAAGEIGAAAAGDLSVVIKINARPNSQAGLV